jgi:hypothetical protein
MIEKSTITGEDYGWLIYKEDLHAANFSYYLTDTIFYYRYYL